jgi:hypothetical protein
MRPLAVAVILCTSLAAGGGGKRAGSKKMDEQAWVAAEAALHEGLAAEGSQPTAIARGNLPGLFTVTGGSYSAIATYVVGDGKLMARGAGLGALTDYMKSAQLLQQTQATPADLITLIYYFNAFPPKRSLDNLHRDDSTISPELNPRLERGDFGARLVLNYHVPLDTQHFQPPPKTQDIVRWTLAIPPDYALAWSKETLTVPRPVQ